jgi:hypothetical protein
MNALYKISGSERYARCIQSSKRVRWDIDEDVIHGRRFDVAQKFLPAGFPWRMRLRPCPPMKNGS